MEEYSSDDSVDCSGRVPAENFRGDKHLECISLDPSCNYIMYGTFLYCVSLITMKLSSGIESIEDDAFFGCSSLDTLQIPITVQRIGTRLFKKCCSLRILYYPAIKQSPRYDELIDSNTNVIILRSEVCPRHSIDDELNKHTVISFEQLVRCIDILPNNLFNESDLYILFNGLNLFNEEIVRKASIQKLTILHLLLYFPGDIYEPLCKLMEKCPIACIVPDIKGKFPLHHIIASTKHNIDNRSYELVKKNTPNSIVHTSIVFNSPWEHVKDIAIEMIGGLREKDKESGLLPFMMVAENNYDLNSVYELLTMQPDVLNQFIDSSKPISTDCSVAGRAVKRRRHNKFIYKYI